MSGGFDDIGAFGIAELEDETPGVIPATPRSIASRIIKRYECAMEKAGEDVQFLRLPNLLSATVKCVVRDLRPEEFVPGVEQGSKMGIILASTIVSAGYPAPLKKKDRVVRRSEVNTINHDPEFLRIGSEDIAVKFIFKG